MNDAGPPTDDVADDVVEVINPEAAAPWVITGDHAGNAVPRVLKNLGVEDAELARHIGWDIGAAGVARRLARHLGATAVLGRISRLVIDPNRPLGDPDCIPAVSDGTAIPGNVRLSAGDIKTRADSYYWPYHRAIDEHIGRLRALGRPPAVVAVHSFTPALSSRQEPRPWHVGIMFSHDDRLGRQLMARLAREPGLVIGENQPYSGFIHGYAQKLHGLAQMLPHAQIEVRQDLIAGAAGQEAWAVRLAEALG